MEHSKSWQGKYSTILHQLTPDICSNPDIDVYPGNILESDQMAAELSVPKHTGNHYNKRINFLPQEAKLYTV